MFGPGQLHALIAKTRNAQSKGQALVAALRPLLTVGRRSQPANGSTAYAFGRWWGNTDLATTAIWVLLNPATRDTEQRHRPMLQRCISRSRPPGIRGWTSSSSSPSATLTQATFGPRLTPSVPPTTTRFRWPRSPQRAAPAGARFRDDTFANSPVGPTPDRRPSSRTRGRKSEPGRAPAGSPSRSATCFYGPADEHLEDRLTYLLQPGCPIGMKGWKKALLTKVLCPLPAYLANSSTCTRGPTPTTRRRSGARDPAVRSGHTPAVPSAHVR